MLKPRGLSNQMGIVSNRSIFQLVLDGAREVTTNL
jgi:hypothetical protein